MMHGTVSLKFIFRDSSIANCIVGYGPDDPDDPPTVQEELSLPKIVICLSSHIFRELSVRKNTYFFFGQKILFGATFRILTFLLYENIPRRTSSRRKSPVLEPPTS